MADFAARRMLLGVFGVMAVAMSAALGAPESDRIPLVAGVVETGAGSGAGWSAAEVRAGAAQLFEGVAQELGAGSTRPFLVQFSRPLDATDRARMDAAGIRIHGFLPGHACLAGLTAAQLARVGGLAGVRWIGEWRAAYKLEPALARAVAAANAADSEESVTVSIQTLTRDDVDDLCAVVIKAGGAVMLHTGNAGSQAGLVRAKVPASAVAVLAGHGGVAWIERYVAPRLLNDEAVAAPRMNATNAWFDHGLTGAGQIVGHADTGLDIGNTNGIHPDFAGRIVLAVGLSHGPFGRGGKWDDPDGHGTHTAGSILGSGAASGGQYRGVAYEAGLVHQSVIDKLGLLTGIPGDLHDLFHQTYTNGARIHSDSWGASVAGRYDTEAQQCDQYMWDHPDMLLVFAASNDGIDADADGVIDLDSLGSPGTAKNLLCVGAAESGRAPGSGGYSGFTYGGAWGADYSVPPVSNDFISASPPGQGQGMAAFSSRGPTDDGRIKPDIVSPGTDIISTKSRNPKAGAAWGLLASNTNYMFSGGTSMSTPLTAGAAALFRQYYTDIAGQTNPPPSAALVKATMLNGARSLWPGQYGVGAGQEIPNGPRPNPVEGWGQVDITGSLFPVAPVQLSYADWDVVGTGETNVYALNVTDTNRLTITLAYSDYPGFAGAARALVNDLDLVLVGPGGVTNYPSGLIAGDHVNNVEGIDVAAPVPGVYAIHVHGFDVPAALQPYALVVRGAATLGTVPQRVQLAQAAYTVSEGVGSAVVRVLRSGGWGGQVGVVIGTTNGSAASPADFIGTNVVLVLAPGSIEQTLPIAIIDDGSDEPVEEFTVRLLGAVGAQLGAVTQAVVTIVDNDGAGQVEFESASVTVDESGGPVVMGVVRRLGATGAVGVTFATSNGTAQAGADYSNTVGTLTFTNGELRREFSVPILDDPAVENNEVFWLRLSAPTGGVVVGPQATSTVVIAANDQTNTVLVENFDAGAPPGWTVLANADPAAMWHFDNPGNRDNKTGGTNGFAIADSDDAGKVDMDTELRSPSLDLLNMQTAFLSFKSDFRWLSGRSNEVAAVDLLLGGGTWTNLLTLTGASDRGPKTITLNLGVATGAPNAMIRFRYFRANWDWWWEVDDVRVYGNLRFGPPAQHAHFASTQTSVNEADGEAVLAVQRAGDDVGTVSVDFATTGGSAVPGADYVATNGTLTFADGVIANSIHVQLLDDGVTETGATINVALFSPSVPLVLSFPTQAVIVIHDDDSVIAPRLVESFNAGPPPGWSVIANGETQAVWRFDDPGARSNLTGGIGGFAIADSAYFPTQAMDTELRSPVMNLALFETVEVAYREDFSWYRFNGDERCNVDVSTNGFAGPWQTLLELAGAEVLGPSMTNLDATAQAAGHTNVVVRFRYHDAISELWWQVDDVEIRGAVRGGNRDTDGDGLQDWWEGVHFDGQTNAAPDADDDGDGFANRGEYLAGTDPHDASELLEIAALAVGTNANVMFETVSGIVYRLDLATNLLGPWIFGSNVAGQGGVMAIGGDGAGAAKFYRVEVVQ